MRYKIDFNKQATLGLNWVLNCDGSDEGYEQTLAVAWANSVMQLSGIASFEEPPSMVENAMAVSHPDGTSSLYLVLYPDAELVLGAYTAHENQISETARNTDNHLAGFFDEALKYDSPVELEGCARVAAEILDIPCFEWE